MLKTELVTIMIKIRMWLDVACNLHMPTKVLNSYKVYAFFWFYSIN